MTSFGPFEFSQKTYVKLLRRKKVSGHSRFTFTRFKCAPFHLYSLFASTWHGSDDRSKKYNFSPQNLRENMNNMAAVTSAVNQQFAILEKRRTLVQVKTSGNAIGDWRTGQLLAFFSSVPSNSLSWPWSSLHSKRFRLVSEQRKAEERDFRFWPHRTWDESQKMKLGEEGDG